MTEKRQGEAEPCAAVCTHKLSLEAARLLLLNDWRQVYSSMRKGKTK